jgi:hypothetical protein
MMHFREAKRRSFALKIIMDARDKPGHDSDSEARSRPQSG